MEEKKEKVAKLVVFEVVTRVVVDKNEMPECEEEDAINKAISKLSAEEVRNLICWDNCVDVMVDTECPYGTFDSERGLKEFEVTVYNRFNPDEREVVTVSAKTQEEAERNAIGGTMDGWGVFDSKEIY